jgi:putative oxidoreductase
MLKLIRPLSLPSTYTLVPLRLLTGTGFLLHGLAKLNRGPAKFGALLRYTGVPFPVHTAWAVTLLEIFGGLALIVGAFVTIVSFPLIISMLVAMLSLQIHYGFSAVNTIGLTPSGPVFGPPGYEINLLYITALIALALSGPTGFSIDGLMAQSSRQRPS